MMPPFFAALPSVPRHAAETDDHDTDRYGAGLVAAASSKEESLGNGETGAGSPPNPSQKPRRRRRGGRGRRKGGSMIPSRGEPAPPEGDEP